MQVGLQFTQRLELLVIMLVLIFTARKELLWLFA